MTASQFEDTSSKSVGKFFVLRPQSGSERELTDPLTSMRCLAAVLTCMFRAETKHVHLSALERRSGVVFRFAPTARKFCRAVQADFLLVFLCGFPDPICDTYNIADVFEGLLTRQCSCCSFVKQWSGIHRLFAEVVVHGR